MLDLSGLDVQKWRVEKVWFANLTFGSFDELVERYKEGHIPKPKLTYPEPEEGTDFISGMLTQRGHTFPKEPRAGPKQYQPHGNRFSIRNQRVEYMQWEFSWRMSASNGIQLFDIRFAGERVVYELSLQEIAVLYSGANPASFFSQVADTVFGLGSQAHGLLPGVDCPEYAAFLDTLIYFEEIDKPQSYPKAVCVFEHNKQTPLRRHKASSYRTGFYHGGLVDYVLVLRTCFTLFNYDYVMDFVFHNNGALEVMVRSTGYILGSFFFQDEDPFGFRLQESMFGGIHHHLFHFKADLDIVNTENRYETLDFYLDNRTWEWTVAGKPHFQTAMQRNLHLSEKDAVTRQDSSTPRYHVIYSTNLNKQGNQRGYRIFNRAPSPQLLPQNFGVERTMPWSRYQLALTLRKENEESSSSAYAQFDASDPVVNFQSYIDDDENIVDKVI